jgi:hypothetical protein
VLFIRQRQKNAKFEARPGKMSENLSWEKKKKKEKDWACNSTGSALTKQLEDPDFNPLYCKVTSCFAHGKCVAEATHLMMGRKQR